MTGQLNASRVGSSSAAVTAGGGISQPMSSVVQPGMPHGYPGKCLKVKCEVESFIVVVEHISWSNIHSFIRATTVS